MMIMGLQVPGSRAATAPTAAEAAAGRQVWSLPTAAHLRPALSAASVEAADWPQDFFEHKQHTQNNANNIQQHITHNRQQLAAGLMFM